MTIIRQRIHTGFTSDARIARRKAFQRKMARKAFLREFMEPEVLLLLTCTCGLIYAGITTVLTL